MRFSAVLRRRHHAALFGLSPLALAAAAAMIAAPAYAEDAVAEAAEAENAADTILVTGVREEGVASGTKTGTPLIETPQAITVIDGRELERRNAISLNQAVGYVAGISANQRGGTVSRYDQMFLRGFAPGLYLDGMRLIAGPYSTPQTDFNRIDQIDILKGPASVLYGNGTPGGLINLTSKMPEAEAFGRFEGQIGNYNSLRAVGDVNQPLDADGKWRARVVGGWQKADGFTKMAEAERYHVSPSLAFVPDEKTSITLIASYQHSPSGGGYSGVSAYGSVLPNPNGPVAYNINTGDPAYEVYDHKQKSIAAIVRHEFNDHLAFRSNFRFQNNKLTYRQLYVAGFRTTGTGLNINSDFSTIIRGGGGADEDFDTLTMDNSLNAKFETWGIEHDVLVGLDYLNITGENVQQFNTGQTANPLTSVPNLNLYNPVYGGQMPSMDLTVLSPAYVNTYTKRDQIGLYIQDQIKIGRLALIASGRWDWYDQNTLNKKNNAVTPLSQSAFTMRLGALYEFEFGLSPYVSYSESFEPQAGADYLGTPFDPTTGKMFEGGLKYQPRGLNAIFTLAAYELKRQKVPVGDPLAGTAGRPSNAQVQIGETRVRGVELEGRGEVSPGFDVIFAGTYTDAVITQGTPAVPAAASTLTRLGTTGIPSTTGTKALGVPEWQASAFLSYDFGKGGAGEQPLGGLSLGGGFRYVDGSWGTTSYKVVNSVTTFESFKTKGFTLFDAVIGYDLGFASPSLQGLSVALNAQNLFNKKHISACPFTNSCYFGALRTVVGSVRYKW
ncbi:ligand-gated channel [Sphingomonas sp. DBB INV C78]|uniref:TonB-dependent siderophore receptor n=1 Tax=Sphingomonas sp. DBB INV C78 TaxID=3349434 RepID=UPI0036D3874D